MNSLLNCKLCLSLGSLLCPKLLIPNYSTLLYLYSTVKLLSFTELRLAKLLLLLLILILYCFLLLL